MPDSSDPRSMRVQALKHLRKFREGFEGIGLGKQERQRAQSRAITDEECHILYTTLQAHRIGRVIECGTANGYSACWQVQAMLDSGASKQPTLDTWDIEDREKVWTHELLAHYEPYITCHHASFVEDFPGWYKPDIRRTAFFIDGDHGRVAFNADWAVVEAVMRKGDVAILHDAQGYAWINRKVWRVTERPDWDGGVVTSQRGVGVLWRV